MIIKIIIIIIIIIHSLIIIHLFSNTEKYCNSCYLPIMLCARFARIARFDSWEEPESLAKRAFFDSWIETLSSPIRFSIRAGLDTRIETESIPSPPDSILNRSKPHSSPIRFLFWARFDTRFEPDSIPESISESGRRWTERDWQLGSGIENSPIRFQDRAGIDFHGSLPRTARFDSRETKTQLYSIPEESQDRVAPDRFGLDSSSIRAESRS